MPIRRPVVSKKFGNHRYALFEDMPLSKREAKDKADVLKEKYKSVRVIKLSTGWFIYHYPQYLD